MFPGLFCKKSGFCNCVFLAKKKIVGITPTQPIHFYLSLQMCFSYYRIIFYLKLEPFLIILLAL
jgi:hypothetical protein